MERSMDDLLGRQVSALVSTTTDAVCTKGENVPVHGGAVLRNPGIHCAERQRARSSLQMARPQGLKGVDLHAQLLRPVEAICWQGN